MFENNPPIKIDMNASPRKAHYEYFCSMAYPYVGITVNVDITRLMEWRRQSGAPFFLSLLYHVERAANSVPELRRRIYNDEVLEFPWCPSSHTVAKPDGTYAYCVLNSNIPFYDFLSHAKQAQEICRTSGNIEEDDSAVASLFISSVPWMTYTALVQPVPYPADSNPRISWGKYTEENGRITLPVSLLCHHALVDGLHIARFYEALNEELANI